MRKALVLLVVLTAVSSNAFGAGNGRGFETDSCVYPADRPLPGSGDVIASEDFATLQAAVDAAQPGDTVLVAPGVYHEAVVVHTPSIRIRGLDRDGVVLDGRILNGAGDVVGYREVGLTVDGYNETTKEVFDRDFVVVENMTARYYSRHGFIWDDVEGFWGRYLTAHSNGLYGLYAFGARCGQFDHSYTSGNADSGFYIGECFPCDAVIHDIVAEDNALGYSGTNAGGNLLLRDSIWRNNAMGIVPNSLDGEERPPQRAATIKNNIVESNNNKIAPGTGLAGTYWGVGIVVAGGVDNVIAGNVVSDHGLGGIVLSPLPDQNVWLAAGNTIWGNTVEHDPVKWPRSIDLGQAASSGPGNCWQDNEFGNSAPAAIEVLWSCTAMTTPPGGDPTVEIGLIEGAAGLNGRAQTPWQQWPAPTNPDAGLQMPSDDETETFADDGAVDEWLPALGL